MNHYQNSECKNHYLHDYRQIQVSSKGVLEQCSRCKDRRFFPTNVPDDVYLSFHIRSALQPGDSLFEREYPQLAKKLNTYGTIG